MRTVERIGWYKNAFVLPDETIGPTNGEMVRLQSAREQQHCYGTAGSLDDWQRNVAFYCQGNSLLAFAVSCAFAAPLLPFTEDQGGGFHLIADTTVGKSTILMAAGSVWGGGPQNGFLQSWLTAANGLENTAEWHNHCLLCLDELKLIEPEEAGKAAYSLSNGQRKVRQNREGYAQRKAEWQLLFLSNGELSLETHLEGIGRRFYGGQAVRFFEIPACMHEKYGAFEKLHCFGSAKDLADHLKHHTRERCYGTAGRAFLRKLTEHDHDVIVATVKKSVSEFIRRYVPEGLSAEVTRAADRFALVSAAGDLATQLGLTGWKKGEAAGSVAICFDAWRRNRRTDVNWDERGVISAVRAALLAHGRSRFQYYEETQESNANESNHVAPIYNRLGFKTRDANCRTEYLLKREQLAEICKPYPVDYAITALRRNDLLNLSEVASEKKLATVRRKPPEMRRSRWYSINERIFEDEHDDLELGEEVVSQVSQTPGERPIN